MESRGPHELFTRSGAPDLTFVYYKVFVWLFRAALTFLKENGASKYAVEELLLLLGFTSSSSSSRSPSSSESFISWLPLALVRLPSFLLEVDEWSGDTSPGSGLELLISV